MIKQAEATKYDQILAVLAEGEPLSTYRIARRIGVKGPGQALVRLRVLSYRGLVERVEGDRPGWFKWKLTE